MFRHVGKSNSDRAQGRVRQEARIDDPKVALGGILELNIGSSRDWLGMSSHCVSTLERSALSKYDRSLDDSPISNQLLVHAW